LPGCRFRSIAIVSADEDFSCARAKSFKSIPPLAQQACCAGQPNNRQGHSCAILTTLPELGNLTGKQGGVALGGFLHPISSNRGKWQGKERIQGRSRQRSRRAVYFASSCLQTPSIQTCEGKNTKAVGIDREMQRSWQITAIMRKLIVDGQLHCYGPEEMTQKTSVDQYGYSCLRANTLPGSWILRCIASVTDLEQPPRDRFWTVLPLAGGLAGGLRAGGLVFDMH